MDLFTSGMPETRKKKSWCTACARHQEGRRGEKIFLSIHSSNSPWKARNTCRNHVINGWYLVSCYSCWQNTNAMYKESIFKITVKDCQKRSHLIIHIPSVHTITTLFRLLHSFKFSLFGIETVWMVYFNKHNCHFLFLFFAGVVERHKPTKKAMWD